MRNLKVTIPRRHCLSTALRHTPAHRQIVLENTEALVVADSIITRSRGELDPQQLYERFARWILPSIASILAITANIVIQLSSNTLSLLQKYGLEIWLFERATTRRIEGKI